MRVEWHLEHSRCAAGRRRPRTGSKAFPVRPSRFIKMNVRVDHARENRQAPRLDLRSRRTGQILSERNDLSIGDPDVALVSAHEQIEIMHGENDGCRMTNDELSPNDETRNCAFFGYS